MYLPLLMAIHYVLIFDLFVFRLCRRCTALPGWRLVGWPAVVASVMVSWSGWPVYAGRSGWQLCRWPSWLGGLGVALACWVVGRQLISI